MTLKITSELTGNQYRVVKAVAVIPKSKKNGVPRRFQKSWKQRTVAPNFACEEMRPAFEAEANRWQARIMAKIASENKSVTEEKVEETLI